MVNYKIKTNYKTSLPNYSDPFNNNILANSCPLIYFITFYKTSIQDKLQNLFTKLFGPFHQQHSCEHLSSYLFYNLLQNFNSRQITKPLYQIIRTLSSTTFLRTLVFLFILIHFTKLLFKTNHKTFLPNYSDPFINNILANTCLVSFL